MKTGISELVAAIAAAFCLEDTGRVYLCAKSGCLSMKKKIRQRYRQKITERKPMLLIRQTVTMKNNIFGFKYYNYG